MGAGIGWLWLIGGALFGVAGLGCLYAGLLRGRARGRQRCPKCWYDMGGVAQRAGDEPEPGSLVCPECGTDARTLARLTRSRRRWPLIAFGIVMLVGGVACVLMPGALRDGWRSQVPTFLLLRLVPDRAESITLRAPGQVPATMPIRPFANNVSKHDPWAAELIRRAAAEELSASGWSLLLFDDGFPRRKWVEGYPYPVVLSAPAWSFGAQSANVSVERVSVNRVQTRFDSTRAVFLGYGSGSSTTMIGALDVGRHEIDIELRVLPTVLTPVAMTQSGIGGFVTRLRLHVEVAERPEDVFRTVGDEASGVIDDYSRCFVGKSEGDPDAGMWGWYCTIPVDGVRYAFRLDTRGDTDPDDVPRDDALSRCFVGANVELLLDGEVVETAECRVTFDEVMGFTLFSPLRSFERWTTLSSDDRKRYRIRLRGAFASEIGAQPGFDAFWAGTVELPYERSRMKIREREQE